MGSSRTYSTRGRRSLACKLKLLPIWLFCSMSANIALIAVVAHVHGFFAAFLPLLPSSFVLFWLLKDDVIGREKKQFHWWVFDSLTEPLKLITFAESSVFGLP